MTIWLAGVFGLLIGSFLNVCIYRVPRGLGVVTPRSFCPECGTPIAARDNVPVLSFLWLGGKCRHCGKAIGWRYPLVEALTGAVFAVVVARYGTTLLALKWLVFESLLMVLFWTDLEERMLPDEFTLGGFGAAGVLAIFVEVPSGLLDYFAGEWVRVWRSLGKLAASAAVLALPIWLVAAIYSWLRKRDGLGLGDVKLLAMLGAFLGLENGLEAMLIASLAGSAVGLALVARYRGAALHFELPFGSFLSAGAAILPLVKQLL